MSGTKRKTLDFLIDNETGQALVSVRQTAEMLTSNSRARKRIKTKIVKDSAFTPIEDSNSQFVDAQKLAAYIENQLDKEPSITKECKERVVSELVDEQSMERFVVDDDQVKDTFDDDIALMNTLIRLYAEVKYVKDEEELASKVLSDIKDHYRRVRLYVKEPLNPMK